MNTGVAIYATSTEGRLRQGEILSHVVQYKLDPESANPEEKPDFNEVIHPLAIIVSQGCDLESDYDREQQGNRPESRFLPNLLFCEVCEASALRQPGPERIASDLWKRIRNNKDERYQFLRTIDKEVDALGNGLPELAIDFKKYFTIPTGEIYRLLSDKTNPIQKRCRLVTPYAEHLSTRFFYFQMRIPLPEEHFVPPAPL